MKACKALSCQRTHLLRELVDLRGLYCLGICAFFSCQTADRGYWIVLIHEPCFKTLHYTCVQSNNMLYLHIFSTFGISHYFIYLFPVRCCFVTTAERANQIQAVYRGEENAEVGLPCRYHAYVHDMLMNIHQLMENKLSCFLLGYFVHKS